MLQFLQVEKQKHVYTTDLINYLDSCLCIIIFNGRKSKNKYKQLALLVVSIAIFGLQQPA